MANLRKDLRDILMDAGAWADYTRFVEILVANGVSRNEAPRRAIDAFFEHPSRKGKNAKLRNSRSREIQLKSQLNGIRPPDSPCQSPAGDSPPPPPPSSDSAGHAVSEGEAPAAPLSTDDIVNRLTGSAEPPSPLDGPLPIIELEELATREASEVECIRWVARNMAVAHPVLQTCPDPMAWALLSHCRSSKVAAAEFWKQIFPKLLPTKAQMDAINNQGKDDKGGKAAEVIDELLQFSAQARELQTALSEEAA